MSRAGTLLFASILGVESALLLAGGVRWGTLSTETAPQDVEAVTDR